MFLLFTFFLLPPTILMVATACSLCADNGEMAFPHRTFPGTGVTCLDYETVVLSLVSDGDCEESKKQWMEANVVDVEAYCGCEGIPIPNQCSFCEPNDSDNQAETRVRGKSCEEVRLVAPYVVDLDYCDSLQLVKGTCCGAIESPSCSFCGNHILMDPDDEISATDGMTCQAAKDAASLLDNDSQECQDLVDMENHCCQPSSQCSLCPPSANSAMQYPDRLLPFTNDFVRCVDVEASLVRFSVEQCEGFHKDLAAIDLVNWCGCEGASPPAYTCSLCGDRPIANKNTEIPDAREGVTCQVFADWTAYVVDERFCELQQSLLSVGCCGRAQLGATLAPTRFPVFPGVALSSSVARGFHRGIVLVAIVVVAIML